MILGIGADLVDVRRIEAALARFGDRFLARVFTARERAAADRRAGRTAAYAKRFAAKEAAWKALGSERRFGIGWRDLEVVAAPSGKPLLHLTGPAGARLAALTPPGMRARIDLSLADEPPLAQAFVVISLEPAGTAARPDSGEPG